MEEKQTKKLSFIEGLKLRLGIKTRALWFSAQLIQEKLEPNKTVDQVYEMLKFMGKQQLIKDKPNMRDIIK